LKLALISDIHGNLPALEAVFQSIAAENVQSIVCLGDIVGYGARPNECVELLRDKCIPSLMGNHDAAVLGRLALSLMNMNARIASEWTIENLKPENRNFLADLPFTMEIESTLCVHSSPNEPDQWRYIFTNNDATSAFHSFVNAVCFFGHTHFPGTFTNPTDGRRLINVGSVGQPRDHNPRACYGIYDTTTTAFKWMRVDYPVETAARHITEAGLPLYLAQRLASGT